MRIAWCRPVIVAVISVFVGLLLVVVTPSSASAHAVLMRTDPVADSVLAEAPSRVSLTFNESVSPVRRAFSVIAPNGKAVHKGNPAISDGGKTVSQQLADALPTGTYLVSYRVVSADGHPLAGGFTFSIGQRSAPPQAGKAISDPDTDLLVRLLLSGGKYAGYLGLVLLFGPVLVLFTLWPRRLRWALPARLIWIGAGLIGVSSLILLIAEVPYVAGVGFDDIEFATVGDVLLSTVGIALVSRLVLMAAAIPLLRRLTRTGDLSGAARWTLLAIGIAALFTWSFAGHAATSQGWVVAGISDAVHVGAMAVWLGGLVVLVAALLPRAKLTELALIMPVWSRWALLAMGTLGFTGVVSALLAVPAADLGGLLETTYGWLLLGKLIGFYLIAIVAFFIRRWMERKLPILIEEDDNKVVRSSIKSLQRRIGVEIGLAVLVLAVATALAQTAPTYSASASDQITQTGGYRTTLRGATFAIQVELEPAQRGNNTLHLIAIDTNGEPVKVLEWRATAALPSQNIAPVDVSLLSVSDDHVIGQISLPRAGDWEFRFTARISDVDQISVNRTVHIN